MVRAPLARRLGPSVITSGGMPPQLHVVGRQNHGKTELVLALIEELSARGLQVGTVKHTSHVHELDTPGKDSHRHRLAGSTTAAMVSGEVTAVFLPGLDPQHPYTKLAPLFVDCDLVLVEGHLQGPGPFVEVWRVALGTPPIATDRHDITAVISDDFPDVRIPVWPRRNLDDLVGRLMGAGLVPATCPRPYGGDGL